MFAQINNPEKLDPGELDNFLERGWFRMGQTIFTTNFLHFKDRFYSAVWLRIVLSEFVIDKIQKKLAKQNSIFRTEIKKISIDPVKEILFAAYRQSVSFEASASLHTLMFGKAQHTVYDTLEVNIYDENKLIAVGFFDVGATSAAGITCFYDPAYKKYSLGKYLIFQKIEYCRLLNLKYFYPGYFVPGYSFFDYKLGIGTHNLQYLELRSSHWLPIDEFNAADAPIRMMRDRLDSLSSCLLNFSITSKVFWYEFFDVNLHPDLQGAKLFDFPVFLQCNGLSDDAINPLIVYDPRDQQYHVFECRSIWVSNSPGKEDIYSSNLLKVEQHLFSSAFVQETASIFSKRG